MLRFLQDDRVDGEGDRLRDRWRLVSPAEADADCARLGDRGRFVSLAEVDADLLGDRVRLASELLRSRLLSPLGDLERDRDPVPALAMTRHHTQTGYRLLLLGPKR